MFIQDIFLDNYLKSLNGDCIKLYLYRQYFGRSDDIELLSDTLNIAREQIPMHIEQLNSFSLWDNCFKDYLNDLENIDYLSLKYSCNCTLSKKTKEWLSLMPKEDFYELTRYTVCKYESLILYADQLWNHHLSIEYIFLILYCGECLDLPFKVIKYLFSHLGADIDTNKLESLAILWADFELYDVESIEYYYSNALSYFEAAKAAFSISRQLNFCELSYIVNWCVHTQYTLDLVTFACLFTKKCINQFAIAYTDKILSNWANTNVYTIDDVIDTKQIRNLSISEQRTMQQQAHKLIVKIKSSDHPEVSS